MPSTSSRDQPAPRPASNRPPLARCSASAAWANSTGDRSRLLAKHDSRVTRSVTAAS